MQLTQALLITLAAAATAHPDWPQRSGPTGNGHAPDGVSAEALAQPEIAWLVETPGGFSSFAIAGGLALTLVSEPGEGGPREVCLALDAEGGEVAWRTPLGSSKYDGGGGSGAEGNRGGDGPRSTPVIAGERVFIYDAHMVLTCLDLASGELRWRQDLQADFGGKAIHWQNATCPLVEGDLVLVAGGGPEQCMLAFDCASGEPSWGSGTGTLTHATPVGADLHGVRQVIFYLREGLFSLDPATGEQLWSFEFPFRTSSASSPVVWQDMVYVSAGYGVGAGCWRIDRAEDGSFKPEFLWRQRNRLMNHWSTPVVRDGFLYGMFGFKEYGDGPVKCVELASGEERWSHEGFGPGNVILAGDQLIALGDAGQVVLIEASPAAYRELARAQVLEGKCWSSPAVAGDSIWVRSTTQGARLDLSGGPR